MRILLSNKVSEGRGEDIITLETEEDGDEF